MVKAQLRSAGVDVSPEDDTDPWGHTVRHIGALGASSANPATATTMTQEARTPSHTAGSGAARRAVFRSVIRLAYEVLDQWYARIRSFRNAVIMASILLAVLAGAVIFIGARSPAAIPLCFYPASGEATCPSGGNQPSSGDVAVVAFLGLVGGGLAGALTVRDLLKTRTPNAMPIAPHTVPIALSVLKLPAGALTAISGLLLVSGAFVPGLTALDTQGQILAYAFVLGFAQQIATSQIDRQAREILSAQPRDDRRSRRRQMTTPPRPFLDA